jgi:peptidoglycan/LPS O-acetylase OafA/YrhL
MHTGRPNHAVTRVVQLDVLRGIAVLLVLVRHLGEAADESRLRAMLDGLVSAPWTVATVPHKLSTAVYRAGWAGVDLFFVLSGFLVSGLLFREYQERGSLQLRRFLVRRAFKIYPAFYVLLFATFIGVRLLTERRYPAVSFLSEALFVQNYGPNVWGHTWSLAVEEHFYLLLALLFLVLSRRGGERPFAAIKACFAVLAVGELILRVTVTALQPSFVLKTHVFATHLRLDALFFGVLLAYFWHVERARLDPFLRRRPVLLVGSLCLISPILFLPQSHPALRTVGLSALSLGFTGLLLWALSAAPGPAALRPIARAIGWIGLHSYSIYLWHLPVLVLGVPTIARATGGAFGWPGELATYLLGSIVGGVATAKAIELPALRMRDRLFPQWATRPEPSSRAQRAA